MKEMCRTGQGLKETVHLNLPVKEKCPIIDITFNKWVFQN